jgi:hypothetical protein
VYNQEYHKRYYLKKREIILANNKERVREWRKMSDQEQKEELWALTQDILKEIEVHPCPVVSYGKRLCKKRLVKDIDN